MKRLPQSVFNTLKGYVGKGCVDVDPWPLSKKENTIERDAFLQV
jgi:hypothetical protein